MPYLSQTGLEAVRKLLDSEQKRRLGQIDKANDQAGAMRERVLDDYREFESLFVILAGEEPND